MAVADGFLRRQRFGRDGAESTTKAYAHAIALFLRWCARTGRSWQAGVEQFASFMTLLAHAGPPASGADAVAAVSGVLLAGLGAATARSASRINGVLTAVRGMVVHAVANGDAPAGLVPLLYEVADDRDLPEQARGEDGRMAWRLRARHRLREPETAVDRASDEAILALLRACRSARDRLIVLLMARAGLRRGEVCGLRRSDAHLLADSRRLGCEVARAHLHVIRREDDPNGAWAKSRKQRVVPLDFLTVQAFDTYEFERMRVPAGSGQRLRAGQLVPWPGWRADAPGRDRGAAGGGHRGQRGADPPLRCRVAAHAAGKKVKKKKNEKEAACAARISRKRAAALRCGRRDGTGPPPPASRVLRIALARDGLRPPLTPETSGRPQGQQSGQPQGGCPGSAAAPSHPARPAAGRPYIRHQNGGTLEYDSHHRTQAYTCSTTSTGGKITRLTGSQPQS